SREKQLVQTSITGALQMSRLSGLLTRYSRDRKGTVVRSKFSGESEEEPVSPSFTSPQFSRRGTGVEAFTGGVPQETQVISIAFRIWLIRNVDLVKATFECKFRVFLEWLDDTAVGLEKGKKA
ncbi:CLIP-associated protein, partial [Durusdinium trenchii]